MTLTSDEEVVFGHFLWTRACLEFAQEHVDQLRRKLGDVQSIEPEQNGESRWKNGWRNLHRRGP